MFFFLSLHKKRFFSSKSNACTLYCNTCVCHSMSESREHFVNAFRSDYRHNTIVTTNQCARINPKSNNAYVLPVRVLYCTVTSSSNTAYMLLFTSDCIKRVCYSRSDSKVAFFECNLLQSLSNIVHIVTTSGCANFITNG